MPLRSPLTGRIRTEVSYVLWLRPADAFFAVPVYACMAEQPALHVRLIPRSAAAHDRLFTLVATALDRALTAGSPHESVDASVGTAR